jgi:XTP/dITP diphosphohydrolase
VHVPTPVLLIATTNAGKFRELAELLGPAAGVLSKDCSGGSLGAAKSDRLVDGLPVTLQSLINLAGAPSVSEDGATYLENARTKAVVIARWSGRAALGDDSGLEVDALAGAPGIHSARYAGAAQDSQANVAKLLQALAGVPEPERTARFRCAIVVARPDGQTLVAEGSCEGRITVAARGHGGFGYDPVFFYPPAGVTFAELPAAVKNQVSHRGRACAQLRQRLMGFLRAADR